MATQEASSPPIPSAQVVGHAFVQQYYQVLHSSPAIVYRFYQDSSLLSRPDSDGTMKTVTTMQGINDMIVSLNYEDLQAEVESVDVQESHEGGVIVLVTGCLTGNDNVRKKFAQSFFLAPQDKGFFVRNDVLQFFKKKMSLDLDSELNGIPKSAPMENSITESVLIAPITPDPVPPCAPGHLLDSITSFKEEGNLDNVPEVCDPSDIEGSVIEEEVVEPFNHLEQNEALAVVESASAAQDDSPKKSYASIVKVMRGSRASAPVYVKVMRGSRASAPVYVPTKTARVVTTNTDTKLLGSAKPAPETEALAATIESAPENNNGQIVEAEGFSVYIKNLPISATVAQVAEVFKKFGPVKRGGIQVKNNRGFGFGFVEFESLSSMQSALEASPITMENRQVDVEEKKTTTRVGSGGRGRYSFGRGGFRNDSLKGGRGNYFGGRGYGRNENRTQGEFSGRPRFSTGHNGDVYQRVDHNGINRTPVIA